MKNLHLLICLLLTTPICAQVGINTSNPQTVFHIDGAKNNGTGTPSIANQKDDFVFTHEGRVGVGLISPTEPLHVNGNILGTGNFQLSGNLVNIIKSGTFDSTSITNRIFFGPNITKKVISSSPALINIGNTGSSRYSLNIDVRGAGTNTDTYDSNLYYPRGGISFSNSVMPDGEEYVAGINAGVASETHSPIGSNKDKYLAFYVRNDYDGISTNSRPDYTAMYIRSYSPTDKRVGIGTIKPRARLDVNGYIKVASSDNSDSFTNAKDREGSIRYQNGGLQYHNSTNWVKVAAENETTIMNNVFTLASNETSKEYALDYGFTEATVKIKDGCNQVIGLKFSIIGIKEGTNNWAISFVQGVASSNQIAASIITPTVTNKQTLKVSVSNMSCAQGYQGTVNFTANVSNGKLKMTNG